MNGCTPELARIRANLYQRVRAFFAARAVLEVETPVLGKAASTDPHIDLFDTHYSPCGPTAGVDKLYLQTSPELYMKRLLSAGYPDIFQISRVFRNGECGSSHNPEFSLLEWYRRDFAMDRLIDEVLAILTELFGNRPVRRVTYAAAVCGATGLNPLEASVADITTFCADHGYDPPTFRTRTDALQFLMAFHVEKQFEPAVLTVVDHFPAEQAVLALLDPGDPQTAMRFEVYCGGLELANGWEELGDADENARRMQDDNRERLILGKQAVPVDSCFVESMKAGFPACSGVAVGLDRVLMLAAGVDRIEQVLTFPFC